MRRNLVLLSGLLCDDTIWADIARRLDDVADITIMAFPGFSAIGDMAQHVLDHAPAHFALAGHSMGGRVALEVVRRAPARVQALALLNTGATPRAAHEEESRGRLVRLAQEQGMSKLAAEWLPPMMSAGAAPGGSAMRELTAMVARNTPESYAAQIRALLDRPDATLVLPHIDVPTLLASGTRDTWSPLSQHEAMQAQISRARLVAIEDAGHMSPYEQPEAVALALRNWLRWADDEAASATGISDVEHMLIEHACARQIHRYAIFIDAGDHASLADLFTEHAVFARPSDPSALIQGRAAILADFESRPLRMTRHSVTNVVVDVLSQDAARAQSQMTLVVGSGSATPARLEMILVGSFEDVFEKSDGRWLFSRRIGSVAIKGSLN
jgi:pimeloyl-ACP methyl ester carboxylesterase